jgi:hypothetical protein
MFMSPRTSALTEKKCKMWMDSCSCHYNRCLGQEEQEKCTDSRDCAPGLYCTTTGLCTPYKNAGDNCTFHEECGRVRTCKYDLDNSTIGLCTDYFSLPDGVSFSARRELDMALCKSMVAEQESKHTLLLNRVQHVERERYLEHLCLSTWSDEVWGATNVGQARGQVLQLHRLRCATRGCRVAREVCVL